MSNIDIEVVNDICEKLYRQSKIFCYGKYNSGGLEFLLNKIDTDLMKKRDEENNTVPIYSIRGRLKKINSVFLKLIRKNKKNIDELTDLLGLRVYCLYDSDIDSVHRYLMLYMISSDFFINEINIYTSWGDERIENFKKDVENIVKNKLPKNHTSIQVPENSDVIKHYTYTDKDNKNRKLIVKKYGKKSGYRSVHYVFTVKVKGVDKFDEVQCEIQLRTLLQDVWAAIEHDMSYKKSSVHPHTQMLFHNLSSILDGAGSQIETIKTIQQKDTLWSNLSKIPSIVYLYYEESINIDSSMKKHTLQEKYNEYKDLINVFNQSNNKATMKGELLEILFYLSAKVNNNSDLLYFCEMEKAYLELNSNNIDKSKDIYIKYLELENKLERYAVYFRIAEIEYYSGNIEKSFINFDKCENIIDKVNAHPVNAFTVYTRIAEIYWSLGSEYLDNAIEKINKAEDIYNNNENIIDKLRDNPKVALANNICWYYTKRMELHLEFLERKKATEEDVFRTRMLHAKAKDNYNIIKENKVNSKNWADTAAWFCYIEAMNLDKISGDQENIGETEKRRLLNEAEDWCNLIIQNGTINMSMNILRSNDLQREHIKIIFKEKEDFEKRYGVDT